MEYNLMNAEEKDYDFLIMVHHTTLKSHVKKIWGWDEAFQNKMYQDRFDPTHCKIILMQGEQIGYLETYEQDQVIHLSNLLILPQYQGHGLGTSIIKDIQAKAKMKQKKVRLAVFKINHQAKNLYERLGFHISDDSETHFYMDFTH